MCSRKRRSGSSECRGCSNNPDVGSSKTKRKQYVDAKTVFALLFLVAVLFVLGLSLGATHGDGGAGDHPDWIEGIGELLVLKQPLTVDDLAPPTENGCREQLRQGVFTLAPGRACRLDVRPDPGKLPRSRTLALRLAQGIMAEATLQPRSEDLLRTQHTLKPGAEPTEVRVDREGGTLTITCTGGSNCRIEVAG